MLSGSQCGVLLDRQRMLTLGANELDVYTCYRLIEAHPLPITDEHARVALLYDAGSPNADFRTAVLLQSGVDGHWHVDASATGTYDDLPKKNWRAFEAALLTRPF